MSIIARQTATRHSGQAGQHARLGVASGAAAPPKGTVRVSCQHVGLDAGYATTAIAKGLEERGIYGVTRLSAPGPRGKGCLPNEVSVRSGLDNYIGRSGHLLTDRTAHRQGFGTTGPVSCAVSVSATAT